MLSVLGDFRSDATKNIVNNLIDGGTGAGDTVGLLNNATSGGGALGLTVIGNHIRGGTPSAPNMPQAAANQLAYGVLWSNGLLVAMQNRIYGGKLPVSAPSTTLTAGVSQQGTTGTALYNNMIHGGDGGGYSRGVWPRGPGVTVAFNTVYAGSGYVASSAPIVL